MSKDTISKIQCPACGSKAVYRDGKAHTGKQRYLCLMCGLQFTSSHHTQIQTRPLCSTCGNRMHLYKEEETILRFRCSQYPTCKTYAKVANNIQPRSHHLGLQPGTGKKTSEVLLFQYKKVCSAGGLFPSELFRSGLTICSE